MQVMHRVLCRLGNWMRLRFPRDYLPSEERQMWMAGCSFLFVWGLRRKRAHLCSLPVGAGRALGTPGDPNLLPGPVTD